LPAHLTEKLEEYKKRKKDIENEKNKGVNKTGLYLVMHNRHIDKLMRELEAIRPRILLADDMADSGGTFMKTKAALEAMGFIVETATVFTKEPSTFTPDYTLLPGYPGMWIAQPTEAPFGSITKGNNV
jgi:hypothetical protein